MSDEDISLVPEYTFRFEDDERNTSEIDGAERFPEAIEQLAEFGKDDPECEVILEGYSN